MTVKALPRSRRQGELVATVVALTQQIRELNDDANQLSTQRQEALRTLVNRHGYSEAGRMVGMSKVRVHQIVNA